MVVVKMRF
jgi:hypothetical protein